MIRITTKYILLLLLSFIGSLFTLEIILQKFFPKKIVPDLHQSQYNIPIVLKPNLDIKLDWYHGYLYPPFRLKTNSKHFSNDQEFEYRKNKDVFRILMLGNSIFMGLGVDNKELFSKNLENILNKKSMGKRFEVINFSGVAWSAIQFHTFLKTEGYKYHPDLVIISHGENDFRVKYNELIQIGDIKEEKLPFGRPKMKLKNLKINSQNNNLISFIWEWVRRVPFYLEISKYSQTVYQIRSKINMLWNKNPAKIPKTKQLGYLFENNNIEVTKKTIFSLNSNEFSVEPLRHSISFFAKYYNKNIFVAHANIVLHSAVQVKIAQLLSKFESKFVTIDIPPWRAIFDSNSQNRTTNLDSNPKNQYYLNPTNAFKKYQLNNIETPLYFYNNNHLTPAGHQLLAILAYNFLLQNQLIPFQETWELIDLLSSETSLLINNANNRIENFIRTDNRSHKFRGLFYQVKGNFNSAKMSLTQYLKVEPQDYEAHYLLGKVFLNKKEFSSALESFKKAFSGHPLERKKYRNAYMFTNIYKNGWENFENGNLEKALFFAKKLREFDGEWQGQGTFLSYLIYKKMGQLKKAELTISKALNLWKNNLKLKLIMASLKYDQKKFKDAIEYSSQILNLNTNNSKALLIIGMSHFSLGNTREAKNFLSKYLDEIPSNQIAKEAFISLNKTKMENN